MLPCLLTCLARLVGLAHGLAAIQSPNAQHACCCCRCCWRSTDDAAAFALLLLLLLGGCSREGTSVDDCQVGISAMQTVQPRAARRVRQRQQQYQRSSRPAAFGACGGRRTTCIVTTVSDPESPNTCCKPAERAMCWERAGRQRGVLSRVLARGLHSPVSRARSCLNVVTGSATHCSVLRRCPRTFRRIST